MLLQVLSDVERIGDHADNITELTGQFTTEYALLSPAARTEVQHLADKVSAMAALAGEVFDVHDGAQITDLLKLKSEVNDLVDDALDSHAARLREGICRPVSGLVFVELVMNLRRAANHLRNIAAALSTGQAEHTAPVHRLKQEIEFEREHDGD
jgi:phosphate:Na+ symporter